MPCLSVYIYYKQITADVNNIKPLILVRIWYLHNPYRAMRIPPTLKVIQPRREPHTQTLFHSNGDVGGMVVVLLVRAHGYENANPVQPGIGTKLKRDEWFVTVWHSRQLNQNYVGWGAVRSSMWFWLWLYLSLSLWRATTKKWHEMVKWIESVFETISHPWHDTTLWSDQMPAFVFCIYACNVYAVWCEPKWTNSVDVNAQMARWVCRNGMVSHKTENRISTGIRTRF